MDQVLHPCEVGVAGGRYPILPAFVIPEQVTAPIGNVEGRIGEDVVRPQIGMQVFVESIRRFRPQVGLDAANGEIHEGQFPGVGVGFFPIDADIPHFAAVGFNELFRLDEHAAGPTTRVIDASLVRGQHGDQGSDHRCRGVELATPFPFRAGKSTQKILVDPAQCVAGLMFGGAKANGTDEVHQFAQAALVEGRAGVTFGQDAFQLGVFPLDLGHGLIDALADVRLFGGGLHPVPAAR